MKKFFIYVFTVLLCALAPLNVFAANSHVVFQGGAEDFIFYNEADGDSDLLNGLHDVMPGDARTEKITIENRAAEYDYVKIYLISVTIPDGYANEETGVTNAEFLSQFTMKIQQGDEIIYEGAAEDLDTFVSNINLGTYGLGESSELLVSLVAPDSLTNRFAHCASVMDWTFLVEAYKDGEVVPYSPDTGTFTAEHSSVLAISSIGIIALIGTVIWIVRKNKKE
ncbi:hypothetical protein IKE72_02900 [Candidatus Saccharibacteria bacterium]|nr:hypothetical protein [Candidatus Saccharibacteria bacterium]